MNKEIFYDALRCPACSSGVEHTKSQHDKHVDRWCDEHNRWCGDHKQESKPKQNRFEAKIQRLREELEKLKKRAA